MIERGTLLNDCEIFSIIIDDTQICHTSYACFSLANDLHEVKDILRREQYILRHYSSCGKNTKQHNFQSVIIYDMHTPRIGPKTLKKQQ